MKKLVLILLVISFSVQAQKKKVHIVKIKSILEAIDFDFKIDSIIDNRIVKENIGFAQKGMFNTRVPAEFAEDFDASIYKFLEKITVANKSESSLYLIFNELNISEQTKATSETGRARVSIDFVRPKDGKLYLLWESEAQVESKGMDVTGGQGKRISKAIQDCLINFKSHADYNHLSTLYDPNEKFEFDYTKVPPKGLYSSYRRFVKHQPLDTLKYQVEKKGTEKYPKYYLKDTSGKRIKNRMMALSDGKEIYIHASRYSYDSYYVKAKEVGEYLYFEDRFYDPYAAMAFGLLGAVASNVGRAVILNIKTGLVWVLTEEKMKEISDGNEDIYESYLNSQRGLEGKRNFIKQLNSRLKS